jgi:hypothetical protein
MKKVSILLIGLMSFGATVSGQSVTIMLTETDAMDSTAVIPAALLASGTTRDAVTEIKLVSATGAVNWSLADCRVVSAYFRPEETPALVTLDLSEAAFAYKKTPANTVSSQRGAFDGMGIIDLILPPDVEAIGMRSFIRCAKLKSITWPSNLQSVEVGGFSTCSELDITALPESIESIANNAFQYCTSLALTKLPAALTGIIGGSLTSNAAFSNTKISISELPAGVTGVGQSTFNGCTEITEMTFPEGFTEGIGSNAFSNCSKLTKIIFKASTPPATINTGAFGTRAGSIDVIVPQGSLSAYQTKLESFGFKSITEAQSTALNPVGAPVEIKAVSVYTVTGNEVLRFKASGVQDYSFAIDRLAPGVYILKTGGESLKVIKK